MIWFLPNLSASLTPNSAHIPSFSMPARLNPEPSPHPYSSVLFLPWHQGDFTPHLPHPHNLLTPPSFPSQHLLTLWHFPSLPPLQTMTWASQQGPPPPPLPIPTGTFPIPRSVSWSPAYCCCLFENDNWVVESNEQMIIIMLLSWSEKSSLTLSKLFNSPKPQFPHLWDGGE